MPENHNTVLQCDKHEQYLILLSNCQSSSTHKQSVFPARPKLIKQGCLGVIALHMTWGIIPT